MPELSCRCFFLLLSLVGCHRMTFGDHWSDSKCESDKAGGIRSSRVVGGSEARWGSHPWLVSLKIRGSHFCAAAILTDHWLLTAAHCFSNLSKDVLHKIEAVAGEYNQRKVERWERSFQVKAVKFHEKYQRSSPMSYDIALLEINGHISFGEFIKPVCLAHPGERFPPKSLCVVGGWGRIIERGPLPSVLREVSVELLEQRKCKQLLQAIRPGQKTFTILCAGPERGGRDACQGDSGGPLLCPRSDGQWVALGITSWGKGCGRAWGPNKFKLSSRRGSPGVFTDILLFMSWIKSSLRKELVIGLSKSLCSVPEGITSGSDGVIQNPAHSAQSYNNSELCLWTIQVPNGKHILLKVHEMDLENDTQCRRDYLNVFLGEDKPIGRFCGCKPPPPILIGASHSVMVQFVSDLSITGAGFTLQFSAVAKNYGFVMGCGWKGIRRVKHMPKGKKADMKMDGWITTPEHHQRARSVTASNLNRRGVTLKCTLQRSHPNIGVECGTEVLLEPKAVVQSPAYPQVYGNNMLCRWVIYAPMGHIVKLHFDDFELEDSESCEYDLLSVFGDIDGKDEIVVMCGRSLPPAVLSYGRIMHLHLSTDSSISARGFKASFSFISEKDLSEMDQEDQGEEVDADRSLLSPQSQFGLYGMSDIDAESGMKSQWGAENEEKESWHMSVSLGLGQDCTGVFIHPQWILTNAYCLYGLEEKPLSVAMGSKQKLSHDVCRTLIHPHYSPSSLDYDVALLQLRLPAALSESPQSVHLPSAGQEIPPSLHCWTLLRSSQTSGHWQHRAIWKKTSILEQAVCEEHYRVSLTSSMLCAGLSGGEYCSPHSNGGPLLCQTNQTHLILMGLKSWGETCGGIQNAAVYSSVPAVVHWISQNLEAD